MRQCMLVQRLCLALVLSSTTSSWANGNTVVIVHPSNSVSSISAKEIQRIYLGKAKAFSNGEAVIPIDLAVSDEVRKRFTEHVIRKTPRQLKSYWGRRIFTGKGAPPKEMSSEALMVEMVSNNLNTIGYVDKSQVTSSVKVVYEF